MFSRLPPGRFRVSRVLLNGGYRMNFFSALFDLSFQNYVTVRLARWAYIGIIIAAAAILLLGVIGGLAMVLQSGNVTSTSSLYELHRDAESRTTGWLLLLGAPIASWLMLVFGRVFVELTVVVFSIAESLRGRR